VIYGLLVTIYKVTNSGPSTAVAMTTTNLDFQSGEARRQAREAIASQIRAEETSGLRPVFAEYESQWETEAPALDWTGGPDWTTAMSRHIALQTNGAAAEDSYFAARQDIDMPHSRKAFRAAYMAGFELGLEEGAK
jgi:hypothetical protein